MSHTFTFVLLLVTRSYLPKILLKIMPLNLLSKKSNKILQKSYSFTCLPCFFDKQSSFSIFFADHTQNMLLKDVINNLDEEGLSLLHWNAKDGNAETVQTLLKKGADIEIKDRENGSTPLLWACQNGHTNIVKILLQNGANLFANSYCGNTVLHFAVESGEVELVEMLVKKGLNIDGQNTVNPNFFVEGTLSPLNAAIFEDKMEILTLLIEKGADVNMVDGLNWTPVNYAISKGKKEIVGKLLQNGANLNLFLAGYLSPLNRAISNDKTELITFLIKNGADINMVDGLDWNPLNYAIF